MHPRLVKIWSRIRPSHAPDAEAAPSGSSLAAAYAYPSFPPPAPEELLANSEKFNAMFAQRRYLAPQGDEDTPLYALYRLYEHLILNCNTGLRNELERFWFNQWPIADIPDPGDQDSASRYAVLACIPALMVTSYNQRIDYGIPRHAEAIRTDEEIEADKNGPKVYETLPQWCLKVSPLEKTLVIPHDKGETLSSFEDPRASRELKEKNILHWQPHIHFI